MHKARHCVTTYRKSILLWDTFCWYEVPVATGVEYPLHHSPRQPGEEHTELKRLAEESFSVGLWL